MIPVKQLQQSSPAHPRRFAKGHKIYSYKQIFADFRPLLQLVISVCDRPCVLWQLHRCLQELRCSDVPSMKATERCFVAGQHAFLKQCGWAAVNFSLQLPLLKTTLKHWLSRWHSFLPNSGGPVQLGVSWMRFKMLFCTWQYCSGDRQLGQQGCSTSEKTPTLRHTKSLYPAVVTLCFCRPLTELGAALLLVWLWGIFIVQWAEFVQLGEGLSRYLLCTGEPVGCCSGSGRMKVEDSYILP